MEDINSLVQDIKGVGASLQVLGLLKSVPADRIEGVLAPILAKYSGINDFKTRLDMFREDVGEDHYKALAVGANFQAILDQWVEEKRQRALMEAAKAIRGLFEEDVDIADEEIRLAIWYLTSRR